ncbi:MAG: hypothetical protein GY940_33220, partial [bacterium]|nr:hypothetical protein [bacterium]
VYLAAQKELVSMKRITGKDDVFATIEAEVTPDNCDFLLLEGLRRDDIPMIEVFNTTTGGDQKFQFEQLAAIVSEKPVTNEIPNFNIDDIKAISEFMEAYHEENRSTKNK